MLAIVRLQKRWEQKLLNVLDERWPLELLSVWTPAFVRGQPGFVRVHKLPRQEDRCYSQQRRAGSCCQHFFFLTQTPYRSCPADPFSTPLRVADGDIFPDVAAFMFI